MIRSEVLFYLLGCEIATRLSQFSGQGLGMVLYAFNRLRIRNKQLLSRCVPHILLRAHELTELEIAMIQHASKDLGILSAQLNTALDHRLSEIRQFDQPLNQTDTNENNNDNINAL